VWTKLVSAWSVEPQKSAKEPARYRVSPCPLRYEVMSEQTMDVAPGRPPTGTSAHLRLTAKQDPKRSQRFVIELEKSHLSRLVEGRREAMKRQLTTRFAPVWLTTSGRTWTEEDGPTSLWSAFGIFPGLNRFFPALPEGEILQSEESWKIVTRAQRTALRVEVRRGDNTRTLAPRRYIAPQTDLARVKLAGALRLRSSKDAPWHHATILKADWSVEVHTEPPRPRDQLERWHGHYVLLDSGRMLHAVIVGKKLHRWSLRPGEENEKRGDARFEMRLVEACDGPVLPAIR